MDAAMSAAARIAWHTEPSFQPVAVQRWVSICFLQLDQLASLITDLGDLFRKCEPSARRILLGAEVKNTVIDEQKNQARAG